MKHLGHRLSSGMAFEQSLTEETQTVAVSSCRAAQGSAPGTSKRYVFDIMPKVYCVALWRPSSCCPLHNTCGRMRGLGSSHTRYGKGRPQRAHNHDQTIYSCTARDHRRRACAFASLQTCSPAVLARSRRAQQRLCSERRIAPTTDVESLGPCGVDTSTGASPAG